MILKEVYNFAKKLEKACEIKRTHRSEFPDQAVCLPLAKAEGWFDLDNGVVGAVCADEYPACLQALPNVLGCSRGVALGDTILHDVQTHHHASSSHIPHPLVILHAWWAYKKRTIYIYIDIYTYYNAWKVTPGCATFLSGDLSGRFGKTFPPANAQLEKHKISNKIPAAIGVNKMHAAC